MNEGLPRKTSNHNFANLFLSLNFLVPEQGQDEIEYWCVASKRDTVCKTFHIKMSCFFAILLEPLGKAMPFQIVFESLG